MERDSLLQFKTEIVRHTRKAIRLAKSGSENHQYSLGFFLSNLDKQQIPDTLDYLCSSLDELRLEILQWRGTDIANLSVEEEAIVIHPFFKFGQLTVSISRGIVDLQNLKGRDKTIAGAIYNVRPKLLKCFRAAFENRTRIIPLSMIERNSALQAQIIKALAEATLSSARSHYSEFTCLTEPEVLEFLTRLWLTNGSGPTRFCATAFCICLEHCWKSSMTNALDLVFKTSNHDRAHVYALAHTRLQRVLDDRPRNIEAIGCDARILLMLSAYDRSTMATYLTQKQTLAIICRATVQQTQGKYERFPETLVIFQVCSMLSEFLESVGGPSGFRTCVRHGILKILVKINRSTPEKRNLIHVMLSVLASRLISESNISVTVKAFAAIPKSTMLRKTINTSSEFDDAWNRYTRLLLERIVIKNLYERYDFQTVCNSCFACPKTSWSCRLSTCAGCKEALYCSRNCQARDWTFRHRNVCRILALLVANSKQPGQEPLPKREQKLLKIIATRDVRRSIRTFEKIAKETYPDVETWRVGYTLDYSKFPARLDVFRLEELSESAVSKKNAMLAEIAQIYLDRKPDGPEELQELAPLIRVIHHSGQFYTPPILLRSLKLGALKCAPEKQEAFVNSVSAPQSRVENFQPVTLRDEIDELIDHFLRSVNVQQSEIRHSKETKHIWDFVEDEMNTEDVTWPF